MHAAEFHRPLAANGVPRRNGDEQPVVTEHIGVDNRPDRHRAGNADIDCTIGEGSGLFVRRHRVELDIDIGPRRAETVKKERHELVGSRVDEAQPQTTSSPCP